MVEHVSFNYVQLADEGTLIDSAHISLGEGKEEPDGGRPVSPLPPFPDQALQRGLVSKKVVKIELCGKFASTLELAEASDSGFVTCPSLVILTLVSVRTVANRKGQKRRS